MEPTVNISRNPQSDNPQFGLEGEAAYAAVPSDVSKIALGLLNPAKSSPPEPDSLQGRFEKKQEEAPAIPASIQPLYEMLTKFSKTLSESLQETLLNPQLAKLIDSHDILGSKLTNLALYAAKLGEEGKQLPDNFIQLLMKHDPQQPFSLESQETLNSLTLRDHQPAALQLLALLKQEVPKKIKTPPHLSAQVKDYIDHVANILFGDSIAPAHPIANLDPLFVREVYIASVRFLGEKCAERIGELTNHNLQEHLGPATQAFVKEKITYVIEKLKNRIIDLLKHLDQKEFTRRFDALIGKLSVTAELISLVNQRVAKVQLAQEMADKFLTVLAFPGQVNTPSIPIDSLNPTQIELISQFKKLCKKATRHLVQTRNPENYSNVVRRLFVEELSKKPNLIVSLHSNYDTLIPFVFEHLQIPPELNQAILNDKARIDTKASEEIDLLADEAYATYFSHPEKLQEEIAVQYGRNADMATSRLTKLWDPVIRDLMGPRQGEIVDDFESYQKRVKAKFSEQFAKEFLDLFLENGIAGLIEELKIFEFLKERSTSAIACITPFLNPTLLSKINKKQEELFNPEIQQQKNPLHAWLAQSIQHTVVTGIAAGVGNLFTVLKPDSFNAILADSVLPITQDTIKAIAVQSCLLSAFDKEGTRAEGAAETIEKVPVLGKLFTGTVSLLTSWTPGVAQLASKVNAYQKFISPQLVELVQADDRAHGSKVLEIKRKLYLLTARQFTTFRTFLAQKLTEKYIKETSRNQSRRNQSRFEKTDLTDFNAPFLKEGNYLSDFSFEELILRDLIEEDAIEPSFFSHEFSKYFDPLLEKIELGLKAEMDIANCTEIDDQVCKKVKQKAKKLFESQSDGAQNALYTELIINILRAIEFQHIGTQDSDSAFASATKSSGWIDSSLGWAKGYISGFIVPALQDVRSKPLDLLGKVGAGLDGTLNDQAKLNAMLKPSGPNLEALRAEKVKLEAKIATFNAAGQTQKVLETEIALCVVEDQISVLEDQADDRKDKLENDKVRLQAEIQEVATLIYDLVAFKAGWIGKKVIGKDASSMVETINRLKERIFSEDYVVENIMVIAAKTFKDVLSDASEAIKSEAY
jgi:hypothetical protein